MSLASTLISNQTRTRKSWWKNPITWIAFAVVLAGGAGTDVWERTHQVSASSTDISWVNVTTGNVTESVSASGTLEPSSSVTLSGSEPIVATYVSAGSKVTKGQVVAKLDTSSLELQLQSAKAQLAGAQAQLAQSEQSTTTTTSSGFGGATTQLPNANVIAENQASVNQVQAQVDQIEQEIAACTMTSPISGTVIQIQSPSSTSGGSSTSTTGTSSGGPLNSTNATSNSGVQSANTVAVISNLTADTFEVQVNVPQADMNNLKVGQAATISLSAENGSTVQGKVTSISYQPQTSNTVTTYPVVVQINSGQSIPEKLLPGEQASVNITEQQANNVLTLPTDAITQRFGQTGVYLRDTSGSTNSNSTASSQYANLGGMQAPAGLQFQPVTVGLYGGTVVQIKSGLTNNEAVAVVLQKTTGTTGQSTSTSGSPFGGAGGLGGGLGGRGFGGAGGGFTGGRPYGGAGTGGPGGSGGGQG